MPFRPRFRYTELALFLSVSVCFRISLSLSLSLSFSLSLSLSLSTSLSLSLSLSIDISLLLITTNFRRTCVRFQKFRPYFGQGCLGVGWSCAQFSTRNRLLIILRTSALTSFVGPLTYLKDAENLIMWSGPMSWSETMLWSTNFKYIDIHCPQIIL